MVSIPDETWQQVWAIRLMAGFTISWFFCLGACLGSFLNVVVWRWPLGRSVIRDPSACPICATRIQWRDNIPIIGWIRLRGHCRACGASIPLRYPLVEALVGCQFVILLCATVLTGGATLPIRPIDHYAGVVWMLWYAKSPQLLRIYAWHLGLLSVANIVWLIDEDRQRPPWSLWLGVLLIGLGCLVCFPDLHPTLGIWLYSSQTFTWSQRWQGVVSGAQGWLAGSLLGLLALSFSVAVGRGRRQTSLMLLPGSVGLILGWQGAISTAFIAGILAFLGALLRRVAFDVGSRSALFPLWMAIPVQLLAWRWLDLQWWWPGTRSPWWVMTVAAFSSALLWRLCLVSGAAMGTTSEARIEHNLEPTVDDISPQEQSEDHALVQTLSDSSSQSESRALSDDHPQQS